MTIRQFIEFVLAATLVGILVWAYIDFVDMYPELFSIFFPVR